MKKFNNWLVIGTVLVLLSSWPIFLQAREMLVSEKLLSRYNISHVDTSQGFPSTVDMQQFEIKGVDIELLELPTEKTAPLTTHDEFEGVAPGEIVKLQWVVNGQHVSTADELWLSNRNKGARYHSWADVLLVKDTKENTERLALVQRLTGDHEAMDNRAWKILWVELDGTVIEEQVTYLERSSNLLGVRIISFSGTALMGMGYYSDLMHYYPSLFYPILYPGITVLLGIFFLLLGTFLYVWRRGKGNIIDPKL